MALLYGGILGLGILTRISFASFYVLLLWTILSGDAKVGAVTFGAFGFSRALPATLLGPFLRTDEEAHRFKVLMPFQHLVQRISGVVLAVLAAFVSSKILI